MYALPVSTIYVVTFSGVTSGGMVTSGTTCWTWKRYTSWLKIAQNRWKTHVWNKGLLNERGDYGALADTLWLATTWRGRP